MSKTKQEKYEYVSEMLDETNSECFAYWLKDDDLDTVYNLVKQWEKKFKKTNRLMITPQKFRK